MTCKSLTSSIVAAMVIVFLGSSVATAQEAPPPGYYAPQSAPQPYAPQPYAPQPYAPQPYAPQPYAPQPYPPQAYPPQAYAAPPPAPGYHEHDGLYLRLLLGVGYLHSSASYSGVSDKISGVGETFGVAVGGSVTPNLVVYGEFFGTSVSDPTVEEGGSSATASGLTATMAGIGPGVAYYLDGNMYVSGTLLLTKLSFSDSNSTDQLASTDWGFGAGLTFGKEWWVSRDWGLGVSGQFQAASMKDNGVDWTTISASVLCSATFN
jgi:hypothetical protein